MIVSFYDKNFRGLQNNASLTIDKSSYKLIKRPIEMNELSCTCEAFTEDIQPTFLVVKDDRGRYVYGALAGIPILNEDNQTEITATDLKSMFSSDAVLDYSALSKATTVQEVLTYIFNQWKIQVNQDSFNCEMDFVEESYPALTDLKPSGDKKVYDVFTELQSYLRFYSLYLDSEIDLIHKKVIFKIGKMMKRPMNIKLWEHGIKNYGKHIASINEAQSYSEVDGVLISGSSWILTSDNKITLDKAKRDLYPIKKKIFVSDTLKDADTQAISCLLDALYNEDIDINITNATFETRFSIYLNRGDITPYKELPCGEIEYNSSGVVRIKIGFRYSNVSLI